MRAVVFGGGQSAAALAVLIRGQVLWARCPGFMLSPAAQAKSYNNTVTQLGQVPPNHSAVSSLRMRSVKRGSERSGSNLGSTFIRANRASRALSAFSSQAKA